MITEHMDDEAIIAKDFGARIVVEAGKKAPGDIQWMPPGTHTIVGRKLGTGEPVEMTITVDAATAAVVEASFQALLAKATAGEGDIPYFDFNHDDAEASAHPTKFWWGGDDRVKGGVRAGTEWTPPGDTAVVGKIYTRFSPAFIPRDGKVAGIPVNAGGLVNKAAFTKIAPVLAKQTIMAEENANVIAAKDAEIARLKSDLAAAQGQTTVQAKQADVLRLETENATLKVQLDAQAKAASKRDAEVIVAKAVSEGKIPGANTVLQAKWVATIAADPEQAALLEAMPASRVLAQITRDPGAKAGQRQPANASEHPFVVQAKEHAIAARVPFADAIAAIAHTEPQLYEDYKEQLGKS